MKQLMSCFLLLALLFSLAACAKSGKNSSDGPDSFAALANG